jgi:hypothetical protein
MSTTIEERLTAALRARAELVAPEDLHHQTVGPARRTPVWRRPAVVALAAAAAVAAVVVPLALRDDHTTAQPLKLDYHWPPRPHHPQPTVPGTDRLSGDVDGDGRADVIRLHGHTVTVTLAANPAHPLTLSEQEITGLAGLANVGTPGLGILTVQRLDHDHANWGIIALQNGKLRVEGQTDGGSDSQATPLAQYPGVVTSWISPEGVAMSGRLDSLQTGQRRLAVRVTRHLPRHGNLVDSKSQGGWCWDVVTQKVPAPCPSGEDDAYDPGPHGSLPSLLPRVDVSDSISPGDSWHDGSVSLRFVKDPAHATSEFHQLYDVAGAIDGHAVSARAGVFNPFLYERLIDLGHGVRGLAVDNVGADQSWTLLAFVHGKLVPLPAPGGTYSLHPGTQSVRDHGKGHEAENWIGPDGQVFTTVQTGGPGQDQLFEWQVTDGSGTELAPVNLGHVCMDDFWGTYGTCP